MTRSLETSTIPYTPTALGRIRLQPRPLQQIRTHPHLDTTPTPALPSPPRPSIFHTNTHGEYRLSTHLVPAAYPRLTPDIALPVIPPYVPYALPDERRAKMEALVTQVQETQVAYEQGRFGETRSERLLWNCVNRYVRASTGSVSTNITLLLVHANGFHKETWETMVHDLLDAPAGEMIDEVWAWEAVQHGDAAIVNAENENGIFDWLDNSRDILNFLLHYLPDDAGAVTLPTRLERLPESVAKAREERGYRMRKLVVVGHSFGGCTSVRVAIDFPKLFSSFILVDPIILKPTILPYKPARPLHSKVLRAFVRRDRWSSREEALQTFKKSSFFNAWNPNVLQDYVDYALVDDYKGGVTLKTTGLQEGISFANQAPAWETWTLLDKLDDDIVLRWVVPEEPLTTNQGTFERVWRRPVNSTNVLFHSIGHLIAQEIPCELARDISDFLLRRYASTKAHL